MRLWLIIYTRSFTVFVCNLVQMSFYLGLHVGRLFNVSYSLTCQNAILNSFQRRTRNKAAVNCDMQKSLKIWLQIVQDSSVHISDNKRTICHIYIFFTKMAQFSLILVLFLFKLTFQSCIMHLFLLTF